MRTPLAFLAAALLLAASAARAADTTEPAATRQPPLVFWHTQAQSNARLLQEIVDEYNAGNPPIPVSLQYAGDYTTVFQKVRATIGTGNLPDLVVAYESMVAEYIEAGAAVPLDDYINDPQIGLSKESLADIFPSILESNRYAAYGGKFYTFPFTKSVLMLYYNADLLAAAGFNAPPQTWAEFKAQCEAAVRLGQKGYALSVDASTVDAIVMSFGGELLSPDGKKALFDQPAGLATFRLIHDLAKSGLAYQVDRESYGDRKDFSSDHCLFIIRSSTTRPYIDGDIKDKFHWDMAVIPHAEGVDPVTVLFGANIAVMKTTPERQRAAWEFVKYFTSTPVTAKWATGTGYLPVRKSAAETDVVKAFFAGNPRNRRPFDALPYGRTEPGASGWQAVRSHVELAESQALGPKADPDAIARNLTEKADEILGSAPPSRGGLLVVTVVVAVLIAVGILLFRKKPKE